MDTMTSYNKEFVGKKRNSFLRIGNFFLKYFLLKLNKQVELNQLNTMVRSKYLHSLKEIQHIKVDFLNINIIFY
jgi:hypothetical protein